MGIFSRIFKKTDGTTHPEYLKVLNFLETFDALLKKNSFLARSDYKDLIFNYERTFVFFDNAQMANTLGYFCKTNKLDQSKILRFLIIYQDIKNIKSGSAMIKEHNDLYINNHLTSEKTYLDNILKNCDPKILLDSEQRRAILSDEDYSLIIAGAGAGKTTTVAAKVKYLVEKKNIDPKQILVISFTNKAVGELKERINDQLKIPCPITTFHSIGYAILQKQDDVKKKVVDEGFLFVTIRDYLKGRVLSQPETVDKLIMFFGSYFDAPYEGEDINRFFNYIKKADFSTLKGNIENFTQEIIDKRTGKKITIQNEQLRSIEEVRIANFLYLNQIEYEYEPIYPYHILKAKKPYTPDFCIKQGNNVFYLEHFGISENGKSNFYTSEQLDTYKKTINDKVLLHRKHNTKLIYTFSKYNDGRDLITHLQEKLIKEGFILNKRPRKELFEKIISSEENRYINRLTKLLCVFINNFKTNNYTSTHFAKMSQNANVRNKLFLDICKECFLEYEKKLSENNAIDFQDMINHSAQAIRDKQITKEKLNFKYIIVDEYQDISHQRFDLTEELSKICDAKIIAVGDDWQSIYSFSGSDISLFTQFCNIMGYGEELKITKTYRNAQEVIDIAGNFIQKNESQIKKKLLSPKHIDKPVAILTYSEEYDKKEYKDKGGKFFHFGKKVDEALDTIKQFNNKGRVLLIGRYGFDARNLCFSKDFLYDEKNNKIFSNKHKDLQLEYLTAHSSKGLGYDDVIIINARNEMYGFPSKLEDDPVMKYVTKNDTTIEYAEERRLFYVALTRTKNRVFIITPEQRPSEFILELIRDYPNIEVHGNINKNEISSFNAKVCPICGFPLTLRYKKNYGLKLWMCTNEPEVCSYITNIPSAKELSIKKCDKCNDGYLIVKTSKDGYFLGCTNYKPDGSGCDRTVSLSNYEKWKNDGFEEDYSTNMPAYFKEPELILPTPLKKHTESDKVTERIPPKIHTIKYKLHHIEKDGFNVLADENENVITDMQLLSSLREIRFEIAKREKVPPYTIVKNTGLVSLATYKPLKKEEFITLYGLGETSFDKYGLEFINEIKKHINQH